MSSVESVTRYRQYAADCVKQAQSESSNGDKTILLNVALAWLRLARQNEELAEADSPPTAPVEDQPDSAPVEEQSD
jgi:hypothetical protein